MRKFVITDIHGEYQGLMKLLERVKFNPGVDHLFVLGDMIDRGKDSGLVVKEIKALCDHQPSQVKAIIGNHEEMMGWYLNGRSQMWLLHGGLEAISSMNATFKKDEEALQIHLQWAYNLPMVIEDEEYVFSHAGIMPFECLYFQSREILWMLESEFYSFQKHDLLASTHGKPIIHGHTPVENMYFDGVRLNCDLGASSYAVVDARCLGLIDLTNFVCHAYNQTTKTIQEKQIIRF